MMESRLHSSPRPRDVVVEQARVVGLGLRPEALIGAVVLALATIGLAAEILRDGDIIDFRPERWVLPGVLGLLLPIAVWRGEERFGAAFLWTLPVERSRHALTKVLAGWAWLMAAVALFVLWLLALALVSGGNILGEETLRLLPDSGQPPPGVRLEPGAVRAVPWAPQPLLWLAPFSGATAMYLLGSALALGTRHLLRWMAAVVLGVVLIGLAGDVTDAEWLIFAPSRLLSSLLYGEYGLAAVLTPGTDLIRMKAALTTGETVTLSSGVPDVGAWAAATLLWLVAGVVGVAAAAFRHRDGRGA